LLSKCQWKSFHIVKLLCLSTRMQWTIKIFFLQNICIGWTSLKFIIFGRSIILAFIFLSFTNPQIHNVPFSLYFCLSTFLLPHLCKIQNTICDNDVSKSLVDVANFQNKKSSFNDVIQLMCHFHLLLWTKQLIFWVLMS